MSDVRTSSACFDCLETELSEGNLNNSHFYLTGHLHFFPPDTIGGNNETSAARRRVTVMWCGGEVRTDIDATKRFFRARSWVGDFFRVTAAKAGDKVRITRLSNDHYWIDLIQQ